MLAGRPPFEGATYAVLVSKLLTQAPPPLNELRPGLPASLVRAVHRALEKEPGDRFSSAEQFSAALPSAATPSHMELGGTLDSGVVTAVPPPGRPGRFRNVAIAAVAFTLAAAATAVVLVVTNDEPPAQAPPEPPTLQGKPDEPRPPPPEAQPPAAGTGTLEVKSKPSGAAVIVDGRHAGLTPIIVTLAPGRHQVRVELADHVAVTSDEDVRVNGSTSAVFTLVRADGKPRGAPVTPGPGSKTVKRPPADGPKLAQPPAPGGDPKLKPPPQPPPPADEPKKPADEPKKPGSAGTKPNPY